MKPSRPQPVVLLAEDFEDARELYRDYLEFSGFTVQRYRVSVESGVTL